MKLSIIIVSYNEVEYLSEAIESCLNQKCDYDYEIIIGDDGSDDGSIELIKLYADKYPNIIRYFIMDRQITGNVVPSIRVSAIMRKGFLISKGEYICCLSGDDVFTDYDRFAEHIDFLDNHPKYGSIYNLYYRFWDYGRISKDIKLQEEIGTRKSWTLYYFQLSAFTIRRDITNHLNELLIDDEGFVFSIFAYGKSKLITKHTFGYRQRSLSIMKSMDYIENFCMNMVVLNDIWQRKKYHLCTLARYAYQMHYLLINRDKISRKRIQKYLELCSKFDKDFLSDIVNYDSNGVANKLIVISRIIIGYVVGTYYSFGCKSKRKQKKI